jgi:hypothetical protein
LVVKKRRNYKRWLVVAATLGAVICLAVAYRAHSQAGLLPYANAHTLKTGVELKDGNGQIYYEYKGKWHFVTKDDKNHQSPQASGPYIVWLDETNGEYQVILYSLKTRQQLHLSTVGNNTAPSVDHQKVAWQGVLNNRAVIYYFDGVKVQRISGAYPAIRPFVHADKVLFAQQRNSSVWQTVLYDAKTGKSTIAVEGTESQAAWPRFENGKIKATLRNSAKYYY